MQVRWPYKLCIVAIDCIANIQSTYARADSLALVSCERENPPPVRRKEHCDHTYMTSLAHTHTVYDLSATFRLRYLYHHGVFQGYDHLLAFACFVSHKLVLYPEARESWATLPPKRAEQICRKTGLNEFMLSSSPGEIKLTWFQTLSPLSDSWRGILPLGWPPDSTFRTAESPFSEPPYHHRGPSVIRCWGK